MEIARAEEGRKAYYYTKDITIVENPNWEQQEINVEDIYIKYLEPARACETRQEMYQVYMDALPNDIPISLKEYIVRWYRHDYNYIYAKK